MKIINFGSLNIDNVYHVRSICRPGETISSTGMEVNCGGKGLNQSIALAKAGMEVHHAGVVGRQDGRMLLDALEEAGVHTEMIRQIDGKSGHCVIQVEEGGQNCIVLHGGANHAVTPAYIDEVLSQAEEGGLLLLQNEINLLDRILAGAAEKKLFVIMNPSPMNESLKGLDLSGVGMFILNEVEGEELTGESAPEAILSGMKKLYPKAEFVLTLGSAGSVYAGRGVTIPQEAFRVDAVDTTAAGDTFTGFFISEYFGKGDPAGALALASRASAIAVTRRGAAPSVPWRKEVEQAMK